MAFVNSTAKNRAYKYSFEILISFPSDRHPEVGLLNHTVVFLCFEEGPYCLPWCVYQFTFPSNEWKKKILCVCVCIHTEGYYLDKKREGNPAVCDNMNELERHGAK